MPLDLLHSFGAVTSHWPHSMGRNPRDNRSKVIFILNECFTEALMIGMHMSAGSYLHGERI